MAGFNNTVRTSIYVLFSKLSGSLGMMTIASVKINRPLFGGHTEMLGQLLLTSPIGYSLRFVAFISQLKKICQL